MKKAFTCLRFLFISFTFVRFCFPSFVNLLDAGRLRDASDLIVVAQVSNIVDGSGTIYSDPTTSYTGHQQTVSITLLRVLKGSITAESLDVIHFIPDAPSGSQEVEKGQLGIFFLSTLTDTAWAPADQDHFILPARPGAPSNAGSSDALLAELIQVIASTDASSTDRALAIASLRSISDAGVSASLKSVLSSSDPLVFWSAATALFAQADSDALSTVQSRLIQPFTASDAPYTQGLQAALRAESTNPKSLPTLAALLASANQEVRRGSAAAIATAGGPIAVSTLPGLLTDQDAQIQYFAVWGLGRTTNQPDQTPSYPEFQANRDKYILYWQSQFPISCAADVTSQFSVSRSGFRLDLSTGRFVQSVIISGSPASKGPFVLALDNLNSGLFLYRSDGTTSCASPSGSPYVIVSASETWQANGTVVLTLEFTDPTATGITYTPRILGGNANR